MTYDELENYVMVECALAEKNNYPIKPLSALLAVVELHKPRAGYPFVDELICSECKAGQYEAEDVAYPCSTIYAIEKELK